MYFNKVYIRVQLLYILLHTLKYLMQVDYSSFGGFWTKKERKAANWSKSPSLCQVWVILQRDNLFKKNLA